MTEPPQPETIGRVTVARVFSVSCFHLLTVATTAWVGLSLFLLNYAPTAIGIGTSHGFYDHSNTVFGWPIIYCHGQLSTPQLGGVSPETPEISFVHWKSSPALALDVALNVLMVVAIALVCRQLCRRVRRRRISLADLCWITLMAGLAAGFATYHDHPSDVADLVGGNLDGPRFAPLAWYDWSQLIGACWGAICGVVLVLSGLLSLPRWLRARHPEQVAASVRSRI